MHKLQSIHPKKKKIRMKAINYACFKLEENATGSVEKKENNFINVVGDKFAMNIS